MAEDAKFRDLYYAGLLEDAARALKGRGWDARVFSEPDALRKFVVDELRGRRVGIPGSTTVRELGLVEAIGEVAEVVQHWGRSGEDARRAMAEEPRCEVFLHSANAVSIAGEIVLVDFYGNRVVGSTMGPDTLIFVVGRNKITPTLDDAVKRAREVAARINALRLSTSPEKITAFTLILHRKPPLIRRGVVLLINSELGY